MIVIYDSRVLPEWKIHHVFVIYERKMFIRLATGLQFDWFGFGTHKQEHIFCSVKSDPVKLETSCTVIPPPTVSLSLVALSTLETFSGDVFTESDRHIHLPWLLLPFGASL